MSIKSLHLALDAIVPCLAFLVGQAPITGVGEPDRSVLLVNDPVRSLRLQLASTAIGSANSAISIFGQQLRTGLVVAFPQAQR